MNTTPVDYEFLGTEGERGLIGPHLPTHLPEVMLRERAVIRVQIPDQIIFVVIWSIHYDPTDCRFILVVGRDAKQAEREGLLP